MKLTIASLLILGALCEGGCRDTGLQSTPQNGVIGKWRSADGNYVVEFLPTGDCSARYRMHGQDLGGPCTFSVDKNEITIRYHGLDSHRPDEKPNTSVMWHYSLAGDALNVSVQGNSLLLQRVR